MQKLFVLAAVLLMAGSGRAQAPWLPEAEQAALRALLPEGVPIPSTLKFYRLLQVYQSLYFLNGHEQRDIVPATDQKDPWRVSGGMHWTPAVQWRNATGLALPAGSRIQVYGEYVDAGAPGPVQKIMWRFPTGTVAYDVLIRRGSPERVFEVRTHARLKSGWGNAQKYRPAVAIPVMAPTERWEWSFTSTLFQNGFQVPFTIAAATSLKVVPPIPPGVRFEHRDDLPHDMGSLIPKDYIGTGTSCASCHNNTVVGHRTGYGTAVRGGDGRFTWHPFLPNGNLDGRWPLAIVE